MVGLRARPIKQELTQQMRRNEDTTFESACKKACSLEQELHGDDDIFLSQRISAPPSKPSDVDLEQLKEPTAY